MTYTLAGKSLLHLDSSHSADSVTRKLTALFVQTWRQTHPNADYRYRDLSADPIPPISPAYVSLGTRVERHGIVAPAKVTALVESPAEEREWALTLPLIEEILAADTLLLGVPMYNFSVPATFKAWIDRVTFPGAYLDPDTADRLLNGAKVVVISARGGGYGPGTPRERFDFQEPYLRAYFENLGVSTADLTFVHAELTRSGDIPALARFQDLAVQSLAAARTAVTSLASR
jgi:FMN-dependent NADH-azoreductase